jgi:hypothetical protein
MAADTYYITEKLREPPFSMKGLDVLGFRCAARRGAPRRCALDRPSCVDRRRTAPGWPPRTTIQ